VATLIVTMLQQLCWQPCTVLDGVACKTNARNLAAGLLANSRVTKSDIVHVRLVEGFIQKPFLIAPFAEKLKELLEGK